MSDRVDPTAPHGRDEMGEPLAPYGLKVDGTPRLSRRGAGPGQQGNSGSASAPRPKGLTQTKTDQRRKEMLVALADMAIVTPLVGLSASPIAVKKLSAHQRDAFAGDAVIISSFAPHFADGLIVLGQSKPGALAWMDGVEDKAPYFMLAQVGIQMTKAIIGNHLHPDPRLAESGRLLARMRAAQMAQAIEEEARAMGIPTEMETADAA